MFIVCSWSFSSVVFQALFRTCCTSLFERLEPALAQGNRIWSLRLLKAVSTSWGSGAINSDRGCRNAEEPASVRSFARRKGSSAVNHLPDFSYAIALRPRTDVVDQGE